MGSTQTGWLGTIIASIVGGLFGVISALWGRRQAQAELALRPKLNDLGFWDAFFSSHFFDWVWIHYETTMIVLTIFSMAMIFGLTWALTE